MRNCSNWTESLHSSWPFLSWKFTWVVHVVQIWENICLFVSHNRHNSLLPLKLLFYCLTEIYYNIYRPFWDGYWEFWIAVQGSPRNTALCSRFSKKAMIVQTSGWEKVIVRWMYIDASLIAFQLDQDVINLIYNCSMCLHSLDSFPTVCTS